MVAKVSQYLAKFTADTCTNAPVTMKQGLELWQKLSKAMDSTDKLIPMSMLADYPLTQSVQTAVNRLGALLRKGLQTSLHDQIKEHGDRKAIEIFTKDYSAPFPSKFGDTIHTIEACALWTPKTLKIDDILFKEVNGPGLQVYLPLYLKVTALDLDTLETMLPEKHHQAVTFTKSFHTLLKQLQDTVEDDLGTSNKTLQNFRLGQHLSSRC